VAPSVTGSRSHLTAGATFSYFHADYAHDREGGITGYFDYNLTPRYGAEGEVRFLRFDEFQGEHETHYLLGPRVAFRTSHRIVPYAKFLLGVGRITYPENIGWGGFFAMAPGGGIDYRLTHRINVRADYEYQFWPSAPHIPAEPDHGMNPNGVSVGFSYRIF
jgi:opacity protein-like surface antigen